MYKFQVNTICSIYLSYMSFMIFVMFLSQNLQKKVQDTLAAANSVAEEACSTMRTVRSFANEFQEAICYREKLQKTYGVKRKEAIAYAGYMWCSEVNICFLCCGFL